MNTPATIPTETATGSTPKSFVRYVPTVARILMGLLFFGAGLFGILTVLGLVPPPDPKTPMSEGAAALFGALMKTGYLFPLLKGTEVTVGVLLLSNRFVPLALALIAPVVLNIFAFHAFLAPSGVALAVVALALETYLAWAYRESYRPMLAMRASPATGTT
jgi:hypothetical protein